MIKIPFTKIDIPKTDLYNIILNKKGKFTCEIRTDLYNIILNKTGEIYLWNKDTFTVILHSYQQVKPRPYTVMVLHSRQHKVEVMNIYDILVLYSLNKKIQRQFKNST